MLIYNKKLSVSPITTHLPLKEVHKAVRKTLDKKAVFTTGVGNHQMQTYQFIKSQLPDFTTGLLNNKKPVSGYNSFLNRRENSKNNNK